MTRFVQIVLFTSILSTNYTASGEKSSVDKTSSPSEKTIKDKNCAVDDIKCRAVNSGVSNPSSSQISDSSKCVANCSQDDADFYKICSQNCINKYTRQVEAKTQDKPSINNRMINSTTASSTSSHSSSSLNSSSKSNSSSNSVSLTTSSSTIASDAPIYFSNFNSALIWSSMLVCYKLF